MITSLTTRSIWPSPLSFIDDRIKSAWDVEHFIGVQVQLPLRVMADLVYGPVALFAVVHKRALDDGAGKALEHCACSIGGTGVDDENILADLARLTQGVRNNSRAVKGQYYNNAGLATHRRSMAGAGPRRWPRASVAPRQARWRSVKA